MKRIYVAGPIQAGTEVEYLANIRKGQRASLELMLAGYAVFSPFIDGQLFLQLREDEELTIEMIKEYSVAWMEVSDAVLVLSNYGKSKGTIAEIARAEQLGIPVYYNFEELNCKRFVE